jgi:hypothetical protein
MNFRKPEFITFTGLDDRTDLIRANDLANRFPIEWGLLFSKTNKDARYPSKQTIEEAMNIAGKKSIHLCGRAARDFSETARLPKELTALKNRIDRLQVNGVSGFSFIGRFGPIDLILQCSQFDDLTYHFQLFDISGGRGIVPEEIPQAPENKLVGFAGGMGPDTVESYLNRINRLHPYWIDMETKVRTNGWFDLDLVEQVCLKVYGSGAL